MAHFENSAAFSRQYQSMQDCMCDTEHMFNCDSSHSNANDNAKNPNNRDDDNRISNNNRDNDEDSMGRSSFVNGRIEAPNAADEERQMDTIARSLANQPIDSEVAEHLLDTLVNHKVVAKKFMIPKVIEQAKTQSVN